MSQPQHNPLVSPPTPPSGLSTPSEMPGTPNSTTTSMSALSTVAIKDGHRGSTHPHAYPFPRDTGASQLSGIHPSPTSTSHTSMLAAERADRISRLPGFAPNMGQGSRTKSTVGSASATGSVGRTVDGSQAGDGSLTEDGSEYMDVDDDGSAADTDMAIDGGSERTSTVGGGGSQFGGSQFGGSQVGSQSGGGSSGVQTAERIMRSRGLDTEAGRGMQTPEGERLGKFYFEDKGKR